MCLKDMLITCSFISSKAKSSLVTCCIACIDKWCVFVWKMCSGVGIVAI